MPDSTQHGPHPVPREDEEQASRRAEPTARPNSQLERRQDRNSDLTEEAKADPERTRKPDPTNH